MAEVELKGTINNIQIKDGKMKLSIESALDEPSVTFILPLLNKEVSIHFADYQMTLPLEE